MASATIVFSTVLGNASDIGDGSGTPNGTFAQWRGALPAADANSGYADPRLIDVTQFAGSGSFAASEAYLQPTSPAIDAGVDLPLVTTDFLGQPRPNGARTPRARRRRRARRSASRSF